MGRTICRDANKMGTANAAGNFTTPIRRQASRMTSRKTHTGWIPRSAASPRPTITRSAAAAQSKNPISPLSILFSPRRNPKRSSTGKRHLPNKPQPGGVQLDQHAEEDAADQKLKADRQNGRFVKADDLPEGEAETAKHSGCDHRGRASAPGNSRIVELSEGARRQRAENGKRHDQTPRNFLKQESRRQQL